MSAGVVARARAAVGVPFRLHGRDAGGLDCVGLAGMAYGVAVPSGYRLRTGDPAAVARAASAAGFRLVARCTGGDLMVLASGPGQLHLAVATDDGFVHADLGLGHVVERPGTPPWPVVALWRRGG